MMFGVYLEGIDNFYQVALKNKIEQKIENRIENRKILFLDTIDLRALS